MDEITAPADCLYTGYTKRKQSVPKTMTSLNANVNRIRNLMQPSKLFGNVQGLSIIIRAHVGYEYAVMISSG